MANNNVKVENNISENLELSLKGLQIFSDSLEEKGMNQPKIRADIIIAELKEVIEKSRKLMDDVEKW